jgi:hypothetical protein
MSTNSVFEGLALAIPSTGPIAMFSRHHSAFTGSREAMLIHSEHTKKFGKSFLAR